MMRTIKNINTPATPLNNVHFGLVFYCPQIGKSLPDCRPRRLDGGVYFTNFHGGKDMTNKGQVLVSEQFEEEVKINEWKKKRIKEDARKYEELIRNTRIRLGLEKKETSWSKYSKLNPHYVTKGQFKGFHGEFSFVGAS